jgi:hypothetical protein
MKVILDREALGDLLFWLAEHALIGGEPIDADAPIDGDDDGGEHADPLA